VLWAAALLIVLVAADIGARGGGGGGGGRGGGGGFARGGVAAGGSFGQGRAAGRVPRGAYRRQGPAASGTFEGRSSRRYEGAYAGDESGPGGGPQFDREAVAQQQRARFGRLGPAEGPRDGAAAEERRDAMAERQQERQERRDEARQEWQSYDQARREDWQDYAEDHADDRVYGGGYYAYDTAVAAAGAVPPGWTLSCTPAVVVVGATTYYQCGTAWYIRAYGGGEVIYTMVNPPAGY
jgi:hypothetical protein